MRKYLVLFMLVVLTYFTTQGGCKLFAANQLIAELSYFTITDDIAPFMQNLTPAEGTAIDPKNFTFGFDIVDNESGVDLPTVVLSTTLTGITITKTETPIANGYHVDVTIDGLGYGQSININVSADDLAE